MRLKAIDQAAIEIGIPLSPDKCVGPTTCLVFLGIELGSVHMTARLPDDKHAELIQLLEEWVSKRSCRLKELQSLVGKLSHACAVVPQGRTFLHRLLDLLKGHSSKHSWFIRLNRECKLDIEWWRSFLPSWDGVYFFNAGEWFNGSWSAAQQFLNIAYKELFPIVIACNVWGSKWCYRRIQFGCDNQSVVAVISSGTSKDSRLMQLLWELFLCAARFNIKVMAKYVPGKQNAITDSLSRFNIQVFRQLARQAHPTPSLLARLNSELDLSFFCLILYITTFDYCR